jgi:phage major head subunit gpT-like protein
MPQLAANWPDLMEKDFRKIFQDQYPLLPTMVPDLFNIQKSDAAFEKTSAVGQVPDHAEFTGKIVEVNPVQAYDKTYTFTEYAAKIEIQRKLAADDQYRVINRLPKGLSTSASRSREKLGAQLYELGFTYEPADGDGAELFASDHGSNVAGVAAQSNEGTSALSATSVETTRIAMHSFRDDIGEKLSISADTITVPRALEQTGWEIINTKGKVDTANNNANFHQGKYKLVVWDRLTDTNNWFMSDYAMQKEFLLWWNREPIQFFQDKDSNTMVAVYLSYYRVGTGWDDWRWGFGQLV